MAQESRVTGGRVLPAKGRGPALRPRRPRASKRPTLTVTQILAWADRHHQVTGKWPGFNSGDVIGQPGENWRSIHGALYHGLRGLRPGSSVARFLEKHRGVRNPRAAQRLTIRKLLAWADDHRRRTGQWPHVLSGRVLADPSESWIAIRSALEKGARGLPGGDSMAKILQRYRGVPNLRAKQKLTLPLILSWADRHFRRFGVWPNGRSGRVFGEPHETWIAVQSALSLGTRRLGRKTSLGGILYAFRGVRSRKYAPDLTTESILAWADLHRARHGRWPSEGSGPIDAAPGETWVGIDLALARGKRGLPGGSSISKLLVARRGHRNVSDLPRLSLAEILRWADAHRKRTGRWPTQNDGEIAGQPGETWRNVAASLTRGGRGLPYLTSLARLLAKGRGIRRHMHAPPLTKAKVVAWAKAFHRKNGRWPNDHSGPVDGAPGETWGAIERALSQGRRGLPKGLSLHRLLLPLKN